MSWKIVAAGAAAALLALGGCATRKAPAPVVERAPGRTAQAPKPAPKPPIAQPAPAPARQGDAPEDFYVVKRGDTLYSIALEHGADYREVAQWNSLEDPTKIQVGQLLRIKPPPEEQAHGVKVAPAKGTGRIEARPLDAPAQPPAQPSPAAPAQTASTAKPPAPKTEPPAPKSEPASTEAQDVAFVWPAKGKVIGNFAEPRSKGIDIDGRLGDPVVAAAAGRVTYIGTGIPGLGKLVVIKHDNGFITVYAHNREILVKEQQAVSRGQKIAELGNTDAERPKLHFQIRKGASPVDPLRYLPAS